MDLEKSYRLQLQEAMQHEPVNNMGKWAKQTKIDSINEKIQWIEGVKEVAKGDFDFGSGLDKDSWIAGYIVGFSAGNKKKMDQISLVIILLLMSRSLVM